MRRIIGAIMLLSIPTLLVAHPGRTDKNGGHNGPNGYHYHNGGTGGASSRSAAPAPTLAPTVAAEKLVVLSDKSETICHQESCETIKEKKVEEISKSAAVESGYTACPACEPNI